MKTQTFPKPSLLSLVEAPDTPEEFNPDAPQEPAETPGTPSGTITKEEAKNLIKSTKGKFFTVTFTKKDGTTGLVPVWDPIAQKETGNGYRMVSLATITNLKIGKNNYNVE